MCYSAFNDIIEAIATLDADVISLENSRSGGELLEVFRRSRYEKGIGPGVYDIHAPRIPTASEIEVMLNATLQVLDDAHVWVNPDCGLKTRAWEEVLPALEHMVTAAQHVRQSLQSKSKVGIS
jgi:5-methyltetrahydropteroyltriglutamate--homocysteine methyltransferase